MTINYRDRAVTQLPDFISTAAQSSNFTSNAYDITQFSKYAHQVNISSASSLNITITVQETLDNVNWVDVPGSAVSFTTNGSYVWSNQISAATWTRLSISFTGGSAMFQVYSMAKI